MAPGELGEGLPFPPAGLLHEDIVRTLIHLILISLDIHYT
jgi:hypothetical protein